MKAALYQQMINAVASRRSVLKGAAGAAALGVAGTSARGVAAQDGVRAQILAIPGVGVRQPTDEDMQQVGELVLEPTKANVAEGEFAGVTLTFMGLNNQNQHNFIFRPLLRAWEAYTGATIEWIDLSQADYNSRLQQTIATGTIDFDVVAMGAPYEGDVLGKGLASAMPDWVATQVEIEDYVDYLKPPVGTWDGVTHRISIDGDAHNMNYRTDVFSDADLATQWAEAGNTTEWGVPRTFQQVQAVSAFLNGKSDPLTGDPLYGWLDVYAPWGGFGWYFFASRATAYAKHPDDAAWLFDADTMAPRVNNPAFVRAIQDIKDNLANLPADQINADGNTTGFSEFLTGVGSMCAWWGDVGSNAKTNDTSLIGDVVGFDILPGSDDVYNAATGAWDTFPDGPNFAPNNAYIGWGVYVMASVDADPVRQKAAWSLAAHLGGKDVSLWMAAYPSGYQPYRNSHFDVAEWVAAGYDEAFITSYLNSEANSYNHPNAAIEPRIPGIFQYYSAAEEELALGYADVNITAQQVGDNIAARWEEITDQLGRENQIALYQAALGIQATPTASPEASPGSTPEASPVA